MSNSIIPVPAPVGTNLQSFQNTIGANVVQAEAVTIVDASGTEKATTANPLKVDGSGVTQPVSGTFFQATQPVSAASLPLASGAASLLSGQGTATSTAAALASHACKKVTLKVNISAAANVYVGPSGVTSSTGLELGPGESVPLEVSNTNLIYVITASTSAAYSWIAVN